MYLEFMLCAFALSPGFFPEGYATSERSETCMSIAVEATRTGHDPFLFVAIAHEESRFTASAVSRAGAVGPLQILPRYYCPNGRVEGCDVMRAGFHAFDRIRRRFPEVAETLCHYNSGNRCNSRSRAYASRIMARRDRLKAAYEKVKGFSWIASFSEAISLFAR